MGVAKLFANGVKNTVKPVASVGKDLIKYSIPGALDNIAGQVFGGALNASVGLVSGTFKGLTGGKLNLTNISGLGKLTKTLGYGVGKVAVAPVAPLAKVGGALIKNTPADLARMGRLGKGAFGVGFKKVAKGTPNSFFGYKARALTPHVITAGAIAYGFADGVEDARFNMGLKTAVNGIMDTQGVAITPGSINPSYTPVSNHGATGELPLALHKKRNSGYL